MLPVTLRLLCLCAFLAWPALGDAGEGTTGKAAALAATPSALPAAPVTPVLSGAAADDAASAPVPRSDTEQYCSKIAGAAADARFAWQRKQLTELQAQLKQRIAELEAKQAELKATLDRRDDAMKRATESVVGIYSHMKAEAAAAQIAMLDIEMGAAILARLTQRQSSAILNEIPSEHAAKLMSAIAAIEPEKKS